MGKHFNDKLMDTNIIQTTRPKVAPLRERKDIVDSTSIVSNVLEAMQKERKEMEERYASNINNEQTVTATEGVDPSTITQQN